MKASCAIGVACDAHFGLVHGQEAEQLRVGIEKLIKGAETDAIGSRTVSVYQLQHLLDAIDARDSLAFREATDPA